MHDPAPIAHCVMFSDLRSLDAGEVLEIEGDEAHHAVRVKRLREGEGVGVLDGHGRMAYTTLDEIGGSRARPLLRLGVRTIVVHEPITPRLEVWAPAPKGDRLDRMVDQLTQLGIARYRPLVCERAQRKPESIRPEKLDRIVEEAMKQSRRAWRMEVGEPIGFEEAIGSAHAVVADASGPGWASGDARQESALIVGPEGGWSNRERGMFVDSGVRVRRFGALVMRIETAAVVGASVILNTTTQA